MFLRKRLHSYINYFVLHFNVIYTAKVLNKENYNSWLYSRLYLSVSLKTTNNVQVPNKYYPTPKYDRT